ncbi:MAG: class F sortase [Actinomycetota bacterium]|nr:class F sortase [Actinomycetota bacterium]
MLVGCLAGGCASPALVTHPGEPTHLQGPPRRPPALAQLAAARRPEPPLASPEAKAGLPQRDEERQQRKAGRPPRPASAGGRREPRRPPPPVVRSPARVRMPAVGIDAPLLPLGLNSDGSLEAPESFAKAGWYEHGYLPGEPGPAVIAGHVDSHTGPAVFYRLPELRPGDHVTVAGTLGTRVRCTIDRIEQYPKDDFPARRVYGRTTRPSLRLITCSGAFDFHAGSYLDNTIVFASAAARARPRTLASSNSGSARSR